MEKNKSILLVTNYFPPEKGAAPNRMYSMARGFFENKYSVTVVCPLPNYPQGKVFKKFKGKLYAKEKTKFGEINRLWLWASNSSNKFIRLLSMLSFSFSLLLFFLFKKTPQKVVIQYSPVFVGFTGVFLSFLLRKKIILNVSDLWPLAGLEMGLLKKGMYYSLLTKIERFCYKRSHLILGQSEEILTHIHKLGYNKVTFLYRNYPDFNPPLIKSKQNNSTIKIVYAGLLGIAQGVYKICSEIHFSSQVCLHIYGAGPEAKKIKELKKKHIYFHGEIEREKLHLELQKYDVGFVPLTNRIYGSVPSKIFELSRLGLPILYFAGGEGETIVEANKLGYVVTVCNLKKLQSFINSITVEKLNQFPKNKIQQQAIKTFDFKDQFNSLKEKIESL